MKRGENFCALEETSVLKPDMYFLQYVHPTKPTVALMSDVIFVYLWHYPQLVQQCLTLRHLNMVIYLFIYLFIYLSIYLFYILDQRICAELSLSVIFTKKIHI